jgi:uncharacterized membrane protein YebE (DUF533 family)
MRSNILYEKKAHGREYVDLEGSFAPNGGSALVATANKGKGFTVARTTNGVFTITFLADYVDLVCATATLQLATATDVVPQVGTYTAPTATANATLVISTLVAATATDVAADANNRVNFRCTFRKGSVTP